MKMKVFGATIHTPFDIAARRLDLQSNDAIEQRLLAAIASVVVNGGSIRVTDKDGDVLENVSLCKR